jgi:hypothetical protein
MDLQEVGRGGVDLIDLTQDRDRWMQEISRLAEDLLASKEGLCSRELVCQLIIQSVS